MIKIENLTSEEFKKVIQDNLGKYIAIYKDGCYIGGITFYNMDNYDDIIAMYSDTIVMLHYYIGRSYVSLIFDTFEITE